ncbi:DUF423 domain-containing protein [Phyllobacterium leguminum]|uniref:Uncharacterized membrane protein YgdD (TMEM256/DUF423 family) n=1 Tax=Phyllobacterium leguminum TaxID=314237 RepID=A0A318TBP8_9HYPH|nr:DUF423 domain-containing protein [Phyllobacterium leguminum]PYE88434.1 uncharacterized membrane protein YgdD (TMEM256/DUF423 family) [Phyllobacterium leguminum]
MHPYRPFIIAGGLSGAAAMIAYAASAHGGSANLGLIAPLLLAHAPALLALALLGAGRMTARLGGWATLLGLALFTGDLLMRDMTGGRLFPYAAPTGGTLMILGWLIIAAIGLEKRETS